MYVYRIILGVGLVFIAGIVGFFKGKKRNLLTIISISALILTCVPADQSMAQQKAQDRDHLIALAQTHGVVKVIVHLSVPDIEQLTADSVQHKAKLPFDAPSEAARQADTRLAAGIASAANDIISRLQGGVYTVNHIYKSIPFMAFDVSEETFLVLESLPEIIGIEEDKPIPLPLPIESDEAAAPSATSDDSVVPPLLSGTIPLIGADDVWTAGYTGAGWYVAILDTGIRRTHEFFSGKTIIEQCYTTNSSLYGTAHYCPDGSVEQSGTGSAAHHPSTYGPSEDHGTHVAGIAAGHRTNNTLNGVAKGANIIAVQVFTGFNSTTYCGSDPTCVLSFISDQIAGLDYVYGLRTTYSIASVNMSLGGGTNSSYCDSASQKASIDNLLNAGIATAIASGNDSYCYSTNSPGCISTAVTVGASTDADVESSFSNWNATIVDLFAPGSSIYSATGDSDTSYSSWDGTSMATPHVAGAWALLKHANPSASVANILTALQATDKPVTQKSSCGTGTLSKGRIQVDDALTALIGSGNNSYLLWTK